MSQVLPPDNPGPHSPDLALHSGEKLDTADHAIVLIHGRGATAESILSLSEHLNVTGFHIIAPQAEHYTWYPYSFLEDTQHNEPHLTSALATINSLVNYLIQAGVDSSRIYLLGFSQGACLVTEYAARAAARNSGSFRLAGVIAFSGGLIGPPGTARTYQGSLAETPILLGCSNVDMHIPVERVHETAETLSSLGAQVDTQIYPGMGHTVNEDEIARANALLRH